MNIFKKNLVTLSLDLFNFINYIIFNQIDWLDNYHSTCREVVGKALREQGRTNGLQWLLKETQPLG